MAKSRKRKATKTTQPKRAKPAARTSTRPAKATPKASPSRRTVTKPVRKDDDDIFIPRPAPTKAPRSGVAPYTGMLKPCSWCDTTHAGGPEHCPRAVDADVFIPRQGPPVVVQADFIGPAPGGISDEEIAASLTERGSIPGGWTLAELRDNGLAVERGELVCAYGCAGGQTEVHGLAWHLTTCRFWHSPEGQNQTPF